MECRAEVTIELSALDTAGLRTILYSTTAKATAATVPTAYSAVDMPASRTARRRWRERARRAALRRRNLMRRDSRRRPGRGAARPGLWTAPAGVDAARRTVSRICYQPRLTGADRQPPSAPPRRRPRPPLRRPPGRPASRATASVVGPPAADRR